MKKLLVAALMVVLASPAAFAAIQNVKVSGDITTSWLDDENLDLGTNTFSTAFGSLPVGQKSQNVFITQTRLRVDADLSDNVSATVGLINERAWNSEGNSSSSGGNSGLPTGYDTNVQLYLASVTLREFLYSPLTIQVGRQVFNYGNGLIMGDGGAINSGAGNLAFIDQELTERTAYDGVTTTLDYKPLTISMIYFKNGQTINSIDGNGHLQDGQSSDVYGYNANYQLSDPWSTVVEQYLFTRIDGAGFEGVTTKGNTLFVPGLRASTNPIKGLNVQGELAWQLGNVEVANTSGSDGEHRHAMAAQFLASYSLPVLEKYKPTVNASYTYASGDKNGDLNYDTDRISSTKNYTGWDEFNTIQGAGTIYRALFDLNNENIISAGASVNPLEDVTAGVTWSGLWAVDPISAQNPLTLLQPNGSTVPFSDIRSPKDAFWLGNETDLNLTYNYTEDVTFGLTVGWFVPGDVFASANHETASQAVASLGVKF